MTILFYILGLLCVVVGGLFTALGFATGSGYDYQIIHRLIAATPGLSIIGGGLMFLAIGGVLARLDRLVENTLPEGARIARTDPAFD